MPLNSFFVVDVLNGDCLTLESFAEDVVVACGPEASVDIRMNELL